MSSPDPVGDPAGYQRHLLGLLAGDDPKVVQAATPSAWRALVAEASEHLRTRPEPTEWSVLECLGHTFDAELVSAGRYRWILAHDEPTLIGYDQERWVDRLRHIDDDPEILLTTFEALRALNLDRWSRSSEQERARYGVHEERGNESYELSFQIIAGHDRFHLAQARRALDAARA